MSVKRPVPILPLSWIDLSAALVAPLYGWGYSSSSPLWPASDHKSAASWHCSRVQSSQVWENEKIKGCGPNLSLRWHFNTFRPPAIQILAAPLAASSQQAMRGPIGGVALWGRRKKRKSQVPAALFHQPPFCRRTTQSIYAAQQTCAAPQLFPLRGHSLSLSLSNTSPFLP